MLFPIRRDLWIDHSSIAIIKRHGTPVFSARAENPLEGRQLPTIFAQHAFLLCEISQGLRVLPTHANEHSRTCRLHCDKSWMVDA